MDVPSTPQSDIPSTSKPEKYIRTFAGDMESLKEGRTPDLTPLAAPRPTAAERLVAPSPVPAVSVSPPPLPANVPPPSTPPAAFSPSVTPLKTYAGDFSDRMKETSASPATVLAAEQDSGPKTMAAAPEGLSRSSILYLIAGAVLLIAGSVGAYVAYSQYLAAHTEIEPPPSVPAPIFVDERVQISGTGSAILSAIKQSVGQPLAANAVRLLYTTGTTTGAILSVVFAPAPDALRRNTDQARSMTGIVRTNGTQNPFFILAVSSYGSTFSSMLSWESSMPSDLGILFPPHPSPMPAATTTVATTTQKSASKTASTVATSTPLVIAGFRDEVVGNHDARVYRDSSNRVVLLYGYWNQTTLVIARSAAAFAEILGRLATSRVQ